ncbi:MAG TPA: hypothetical protein VGS61_07105, partial [Acidimicrobiales bacterium]|nr:hypothetical protein [Acidimicrobiales bacterium]
SAANAVGTASGSVDGAYDDFAGITFQYNLFLHSLQQEQGQLVGLSLPGDTPTQDQRFIAQLRVDATAEREYATQLLRAIVAHPLNRGVAPAGSLA